MRDKAFNIAKNPSYGGYQGGVISMVYTCFDKRTAGGAIENNIMLNQGLAEELHKLLLETLKNENYIQLS